MYVLLFFSILAQDIIKLDDEPLNTVSVSAEELMMIDGGDEGFYRRVDAGMTDDQHLVIYDHGNYQVNIYNLSGKRIHQFGKEGNGPREFKHPQLTVIGNDIMMIKMNYLEIYNYNGKLLKEFKKDYGVRKFFKIRDKYRLYYGKQYYYENEFVDTDLNGNEIFHLENVNYQEQMEHQEKNNTPLKTMQEIYNLPKSIYQISDIEFLQVRNGPYHFEILDLNLKVLKVIKNDIERQLITEEDLKYKVIKNGKRDKAQEALMNDAFKNVYGGYKTDIFTYHGNIKNLIFVSHMHESGQIVDVFNDSFQLLTHFTFSSEYLKNWKIQNGHIIATYKNDEIGPYVKVFKLEVKYR